MSIFQKSILNSIKQDESLVALRWAAFQNYIAKIDAIRGFKEEVYQDGFFKDIFESCLGYTLKTTNPADYNLEREKKNETDGKKADGVIYVNGEIIGVVELKDQKTKNLDAVESQAFNYHASHSNSKYIIISNFDELRFYIDKKTAYEKFNLFSLTYEDFKILHYLISYESITDNLPLKLKEKSSNFEQTISKELYRDFSQFRTHLFENIVKNNEMDRSLLLRLTQKLCDRIIFILFAEDRSLLHSNTIKEIREEFKNQKFTHYALYDIYKFYFNAIDEGHDKLGIPKYNGGLFATDMLLDSLIIDDEYLDMEAQKLSDFDFVSDISVNILGHIFEQSLTDLEEMNATIHDMEFDKKKSKRKKDGVFYTPEYITRYIVENTLGKLCSDKKAQLKIESETVVLNPRKLTKSEQNYKEILIAYREWLTHLKILDPACGSGAFLNQALEFLIREHTLIRDLLLPYEDLMIGYEIEKSILEHNLYGVDINEDAVEIAKLSLWLRTAHKGRELTSLNDKIVCANSLLAMPFEEASFDVVIGNPPYVNARNMNQDERKIISNKYPLLTGAYDLYLPFLLLGYDLLKDNGLYGWIIPNKLLISDYSKASLEYLKQNSLNSIINISELPIFDNVGVYPIITFGHKAKGTNCIEYRIKDVEDLSNLEKFRIQVNVFKRFKTFKECNILINSGTTGFEAQKIIPLINEDKEGVPFVVSGTIDPYKFLVANVPYMKNNYVNPYIKYDEKIIAKSKYNFWNTPKIIVAGMTKRLEAMYSELPIALGVGVYGIYDFGKYDPKFLLAILNSKFLTYYLNVEFKDKHLAGGYLAINKSTIEEFPLPKLQILDPYHQNIHQLLATPKKRLYDNDKKIAIANYNGADIFVTEFLYAKIQSMLESHHGHKEITDEYVKLLPFVFLNYDEIIIDKRNNRKIVSIFDNEHRRVFHIIDEYDCLVSLFVMRDETFKRSKQYIIESAREGGVSSILCPAMPFWRHTESIEELYTHFSKNTITQEPFIQKADLMLELNKRLQSMQQNFLNELHLEKIPSKLQKFEELEFDEFVKEYTKAKKLKFADKLEERNFKNDWLALFENDKKAVSALKAEILKADKEIDTMVYALYGLSEDEIGIVEGRG